jgi:hypothetical protein
MPALETPVAPVAAPAAAPAAAPSPSPAPSPAASPSPAGDDFSRLDAAFGTTPDPKPAEPKAPDPKKDVKPAPAAPAKPTDKPTEPKATGPKELRDELERVRGEAKTHAGKVSELETKIADYERRGKDAEALKARLEQIEKAHHESQSELRALKREASPEFKKQYEQPMTDAVEFARETIASFVRVDDQKADWERDFAPLYQLAKQQFGVASEKAEELFGKHQGTEVMSHIKDIMRLERTYTKALEQEKKGWEERVKADEGRKVQEREQQAALWKQVNEDLKNTVDDYKDPVDDAELATARATGISLFDEKPKSQQEHLVKSAHIRHRLGAYEAQKLQIARHTARIAELEAKLEETKTRQPGEAPRKPGGDASPAPEEDWGAGMIKAGRSAS